VLATLAPVLLQFGAQCPHWTDKTRSPANLVYAGQRAIRMLYEIVELRGLEPLTLTLPEWSTKDFDLREPNHPRKSRAVDCRSVPLHAVRRRSTPCRAPFSLHDVQRETHPKQHEVPATQGLQSFDTKVDTSPHQVTLAAVKALPRRPTFYPTEQTVLIADLQAAM